jgi:hypothetical protein
VLAVAYYAISWKKCGDCDHKKLGWIAVTGLGGVTGVFIFVGCSEVIDTNVDIREAMNDPKTFRE